MDHRLLEIKLFALYVKVKLTFDKDKQELVCKIDRLAYPIKRGDSCSSGAWLVPFQWMRVSNVVYGCHSGKIPIESFARKTIGWYWWKADDQWVYEQSMKAGADKVYRYRWC